MTSDASIDAYFSEVASGGYSDLLELELNLLERASVECLTRKFASHPLVRFFNGLVLDDPNTSNHHVLLRLHPFSGQVLYLAHDEDCRIVFSDLGELLTAADAAKRSGQSLPEVHPPNSPPVADQVAISNVVRRLVAGTEDELAIALSIIPSMDMTDVALLTELAAHKDFFVAEAVGAEIAKRPSRALKSVALLCSQHPHVQAARAGTEALRAVIA